MQDAAEPGRLEELRHRAYGRGASLTAGEAAELHDLEQQARAQRAAERPQPQAPAATPAAAPVHVAAHPESAPDADAQPPSGDAGTPQDPAPQATVTDTAVADETEPTAAHAKGAAPARRPWSRRLTAAVAVLAAVALGGGIGWVLAPKADARPTMTSAQTETWTTMEGSGDFDPGSIELLGSKDGASLWRATSDTAQNNCLVLTHGEKLSRQCLSTDLDPEFGQLYVNLQAEQDGVLFEYWGSLLIDLQGREVGYIQTQDLEETNSGWKGQYSGAELAQVEVLEKAGYVGPSLWLMGYDGDRPVWMSQSGESCIAIVVDGQVIDECGADPSTPDMLRLTVDDTSYEVLLTSNRGPQLTIVRNADTTVHCSPGESTVDQTCTTIDDKTGAKTE